MRSAVQSGEISLTPALEALARAGQRGVSGRELLDGLDLGRDARQALLRQLDRLVDEGVLQQRPDRRYLLPRRARLLTGTVKLQRSGFGVVSSGADGDEIFISQHNLRDALDGDRVLVLVDGRPPRSGDRPAGRIIEVKERSREEILGRFISGPTFGHLVPLPPRIGPPILIPQGEGQGLRTGDIALARVSGWSPRDRAPLGTIRTIVGRSDDPALDLRTIACKYDLPMDFPEEVLNEAARIPQQVLPQEIAGRIDLRHLPFVTIDGETARDFDDAVTLSPEPDGGYRLWVAIADVGHYLPAGGVIDREARRRGTSVYFPDRCLPMLPERLSNGICSLNPDVDRLALVAELTFDCSGGRRTANFYPAVIRSRARLTYTAVQQWLDGGGGGELPQQTILMSRLAQVLTAVRQRRGSLDFDLPEAEITLDDNGRPLNIVRRERTSAHRLIEEFMLAANEAVAESVNRQGAALLYRIHEPPDSERLATLQEFVAHLGYGLNLADRKGLSLALQGVLDASAGQPEARAIHQLLLRSMKQAYYTPENRGHFGLSAEHYCHFTSPIRRYPDLIVHRILRRLCEGNSSSSAVNREEPSLAPLGEALSLLERRAMEAEREVESLYKCRFMADKIGNEYEATISGIQHFGLFVELREFFIEGLLAIASLKDDYYEFDPERLVMTGQRRRRTFRIGDTLRVRVLRVDPDWREIDFGLIETEGNHLHLGTNRPVRRGRRS